MPHSRGNIWGKTRAKLKRQLQRSCHPLGLYIANHLTIIYLCALMQKSRVLPIALMAVLLWSTGCSKFYKLQRSNNWEAQYNSAMQYYQEEEYNKANILFELIRPLVRGSDKAENVEFYYAYSYYHIKQYILSAHHFKTFYDTFRRSKFAEEALFMHAKSLYEQSPNENLDQTPTKEAIQAFQNFLDRYPTSERNSVASAYIEELRDKLEVKAFNNARQYYTLYRYEAAIISLDNFEDDYPDSQFREEASFLQFLCQYEFAQKSVEAKKKERYLKAVRLYQEFVDSYPQSDFTRRAESMYKNTLDALEAIREQNNS